MNPQTKLRLKAKAMLWASQGARMNPGAQYIALVGDTMYCHEIDQEGNPRRIEWQQH